MMGIVTLGWVLAFAEPIDPNVVESWRVEMTEPLSGADFQLISEAFRHPEIRDRDLSCYHIVVSREKGVRTVTFGGDREPVREIVEGDNQAIILPGPNPKCPSRSFVMDERGKVVRVIYERH
jgi:hypothetical protein